MSAIRLVIQLAAMNLRSANWSGASRVGLCGVRRL